MPFFGRSLRENLLLSKKRKKCSRSTIQVPLMCSFLSFAERGGQRWNSIQERLICPTCKQSLTTEHANLILSLKEIITKQKDFNKILALATCILALDVVYSVLLKEIIYKHQVISQFSGEIIFIFIFGVLLVLLVKEIVNSFFK